MIVNRTGSAERRPRTNGVERLAPVAGSGFQPPRSNPGPKRRRWNVDGAFPLLLLGSALLVYTAILANEELASRSAHLPLWGLVGGVGAVIVGAGIYSTFLGPDTPMVSDSQKDWVTVPKAEWEALRSGRRTADHPRPSPRDPEWLERPSDREIDLPLRADLPSAYRADAGLPRGRPTGVTPAPLLTPPIPKRPQRGPAGTVPSATSLNIPAPRIRSSPRIPPRGSLDELNAALTELEHLVNTDDNMAPRPTKAPPELHPGSCGDCDRDVSRDPSPSNCADCGRGLCVDCAFSSQSEDGDLRCIACRVHNERT